MIASKPQSIEIRFKSSILLVAEESYCCPGHWLELRTSSAVTYRISSARRPRCRLQRQDLASPERKLFRAAPCSKVVCRFRRKKKVILQARHQVHATASGVWARDLVSKIPPPTAENCHHFGSVCIFAVRTRVGCGRVVVLASGIRVAVQNTKGNSKMNETISRGSYGISQRKNRLYTVFSQRYIFTTTHRIREAIALMLLLLVKRECARCIFAVRARA